MSPNTNQSVTNGLSSPPPRRVTFNKSFTQSFRSSTSYLSQQSSIDDNKTYDINDNKTNDDIVTIVSKESWHTEGLSVVVIGASGDLAKKKTYPSLLDLYVNNLLPANTKIFGYARSAKSHEGLREHLKPYLMKKHSDNEVIVDEFLTKCFYMNGPSYGDFNSYYELINKVRDFEDETAKTSMAKKHNRLFYFAIPPNVFGETGIAIKKTAMQDVDIGWSRIIVEKPFGKDLDSCKALSKTLSDQFDEHHLYRIDHYLGKEIVQNLLTLRFGNSWLEWMWHRNAIQSVVISFKEPFGTEGRGGYFDQYGIIRDVLQNHLLQVLTLLAMEPPNEIDGPNAGDYIRDAKVHVLQAMKPISIEEALLGQYDGYTDDETITNKDTNCPTYACLRLFVNTPRWTGVPFILQAGKALDERVCEVRVQLRAPPASDMMFTSAGSNTLSNNELVMRLQPDPAICMTTNIKEPGFTSTPTQSTLSMNYEQQFNNNIDNDNNNATKIMSNPDAYTRLILDALRGKQGSFVRNDELYKSWEIFTPLLHQIDHDNIRPVPYQYGSGGPQEKDDFITKMGGYVNVPSNATNNNGSKL